MGGSEDAVREAEVENSSSDSVTGSKKGFLSEGCCGSVFERRNACLGIIACSPEWPPSSHVSCRRRGFEDGPGTAREELIVLDEVLNTVNEHRVATMTRGQILFTHSRVLERASAAVRLNSRK